jgi:hypothetical protein
MVIRLWHWLACLHCCVDEIPLEKVPLTVDKFVTRRVEV